MRIKSTAWYWLAAACGCAGLLYGLGMEGTLQTGGDPGSSFTTAVILVLSALLFLKLGFLAQDREQAARQRRYGKIIRTHARNTDYPELPELPERSRRDA